MNIMQNKTKLMVITALFTAIMTALTMTITVSLGAYGYFNLSDMFIYLLATCMPLSSTVFVAGIGCALADMFAGYSQYVLITLIAKSLEAIVVYYLYHKVKAFSVLSFAIGALVMMTIYGLGDSFLASSFAAFVPSFMANIPQGLACVILDSILYRPFNKIMERLND